MGLAYLPIALGLTLVVFQIDVYLGLHFISNIGWLTSVLFALNFVFTYPIGAIFDRKSIRVGSIILAIAGVFIGLTSYSLTTFLSLNLLNYGILGINNLQNVQILLFISFALLGYGYLNIGDYKGNNTLMVGGLLLMFGSIIHVLASIGFIIIGYAISKYFNLELPRELLDTPVIH